MVRGVAETISEFGLVPVALTASTYMEYVTPFDTVFKTRGELAPVSTIATSPLFGVAVTIYEVIGLPPSLAGGLHVRLIVLFPAVATRFIGALGTVVGFACIVADAPSIPVPLTAMTARLYDVPFVSPVIV